MPYTIEISELTKRFGDIYAVNNLSFKVEQGTIFGVLGPNGSGKSTTIRMLCGLMHPTSGSGRVLGYDIVSGAEQIKENIGYMNQKFSLYEDLTVIENMHFFGRIYGLSPRETREHLSKLKEEMQLDVRENQLVQTLSGGWKQRLALACAFLHRPRLLILDEPTAGVDPVSRRLFWQILDDLRKRGITILVTTHYMDEAERCDITALIFHGKLKAFGSPSKLINENEGTSLEDIFINLARNGDEINETA
ncbi:MAG: ABC transporter ATP-binding protein [Clostridiales bacterium]|nr:ABC transporter ATP-binding protein [Clostridiales bacterium]MCF8023454.1 ABC transporter ATP-binding protein [Clostridiales bacterium]